MDRASGGQADRRVRGLRALAALAGVAAALGGCSGGLNNPSAFQHISVSVDMAGAGGGLVVGSLPVVGISCSRAAGGAAQTCTSGFNDGGQGGIFDLVAHADPGSVFSGWQAVGSRGCTTVTDSICTMTFTGTEGDVDFSVTATFDLVSLTGINLLQNPGFEADIAVGGLPVGTGYWRGDSAYSGPAGQGITPRTGSQMLRFVRSGLLAGAGVVSSQQWQLVDLSALATEIDAGKVRVDGSAWFHRVAGTAATDTRFDVRVLGYTGTPAGFPGSYSSPASLVAGTVLTTGSGWQQGSVTDTLPAGIRYLALEIYAYEDVQDDAADPEFDGHYADDASLVLTLLP
ncbi:MAG: hypothetical protein U0104_06760 [Gemmatimonadales bacterium]